MKEDIILSGASGFVGRAFFSRYKNHSHTIVAVVRNEGQATKLSAKRFILFSEISGRKLREMKLGSGCMVHLIGASRDSNACSMWESIVNTTKTVVSAAQEASIRRIIYLSGYGVSAQSSESYILAKWNAEEIIRASGIPYTIFRPSYILGSGDELTPYLIEEIKKDRVKIPGDGSYRIQPLHIHDVTEILWNATRDITDKSHTIDLLGHAISFVEFVKLLASRLDRRITISSVDLASVIRQSVFSRDANFTSNELAVLVHDHIGPPSEMCFGVKIRNIEEFIDDLVASN